MGMGMRGKFDADLKNIQKMIQELGDLAIESINSAMEGVEALDKEKAKIAIEKDQRAYELMRNIEKECTALIMLQAPVAKDLRKIVTALKSSVDLDRIVRYSRNISQLAMEMIEEKDGHFKKLVGLKGMRKMTAEMIEKSLKALLEENKEIAMEVYEAEKDVDALYEQIFRELITYMVEDNKKIGRGVRYLLVGRYLERIADHACNIAEGAIYVSTGEHIPPR
jgi:phosphate transport system protein